MIELDRSFSEIANAQFCFHYPLCSLRMQIPYLGKQSSLSFVLYNEYSVVCAWKPLDKLEKLGFNVGGIDFGRRRSPIEAIATTLEPKSLIAKKDECLGSKELELCQSPDPPKGLRESSNEASEDVGEREWFRRMRISKANKGQIAWNKGRKHSDETLQKIRERTKLAMQNPKVMSCLLSSMIASPMGKRFPSVCLSLSNGRAILLL